MTQQVNLIFDHIEAFSLMQYRCEDCGQVELIYNGRDGVTPFGTSCDHNDCKGSKTHINFKRDFRLPIVHEEVKGRRVWISLRMKTAIKWAEKKVEMYWDHGQYPMTDNYESKTHAQFEMLTSLNVGVEPELVGWDEFEAMHPRQFEIAEQNPMMRSVPVFNPAMHFRQPPQHGGGSFPKIYA